MSATHASSRFERLGIKQGLSQNSVLCILQDSQGFLWVGTQGGLNRYDGYEFKVFHHDPEDSNSISSDYILSLHEDKSGTIWIGTYDGGLNKYDPLTEKFHAFKHEEDNENSIGSNRISAIASDSAGNVFLGTVTVGLSVLNTSTGNFTRFINNANNPTSLSSNAIWSLLTDSLGRLWIGTSGGGLNLFNAKFESFKYYLNIEGNKSTISSNFITSLFEDRNGNIWIGTENQGLNKLDVTGEEFTRFKHKNDNENSIANNTIRAVVEDDNGNIWIATFAGLDKYTPKTHKFNHYSHKSEDNNSLSGNVIYSLFISRDNVLWVGTYGVGLNKFNLQLEQFTHFKHDNNNEKSLSSSKLWSINADQNEVVWVGTDGGGLNRFDEEHNEFTAFKNNIDDPSSISSDRVWAIEPTKDGYLWVGTYGHGLNRFDQNSGLFKRYKHDVNDDKSITRDIIMSLLEDSKGNLWVGASGGLNLYNKQTDDFTRFTTDPNDVASLSHNGILSLFEDSFGVMWVGTYGGGLNKFNADKQTFTRYVFNENDNLSLSNNSVMAIIEDKNNSLWVSTYGGGINRFDRSTGTFTRFGKKQGLASASVYGLLEDNKGNIWMSTNKGISVLDPVTLLVNNYDEKDGLQGDEFNSGAFYKNKKGELYFGGLNGLNRFLPEDIQRKSLNMPVIFTNMHIDNITVPIGVVEDNNIFELEESVTYQQKLTLSYLERLFSFEFSALDFTNPERNSYAYKLEGWDTNWIYTDHKNRRATYTNIPAGKYTLRVKAKGLDSDWGASHANMEITITPAPWRTWWAYSLYSLFTIFIFGVFIYQRLLRFKAIRQREERLSLALWASGNELWDWDLTKQSVFRSNKLNTLYAEEGWEHFDYQSLDQRVHQDDVKGLINTIKQHVNSESEFIDTTYRLKNPSGDWRWIRNRAKAVLRNSEGKAMRVLGTIQDVHKLKQIQDDLRHLNNELEKRVESRTLKLTQAFQDLKEAQQQLIEAEKMASLGGLVAGVAHELNTPLGIATTAASLLEYEINELCQLKNLNKLTKSAIDRFEDVSTEGVDLLTNNLKRVSNLVQDFKQLAVDQSCESSQRVNIELLLKTVLNTMDEALCAKNIDLVVSCDTTLTVDSYPSALKEIILQLISNSILHAFESIENQQKINAPLEQAKISITVKQTNSHTEISYLDNGSGVKPELLNKVFEPFYTTKRSSECTGLGMHIVYNLVIQQMKGTIVCESDIGAGFKVNITLPSAPKSKD